MLLQRRACLNYAMTDSTMLLLDCAMHCVTLPLPCGVELHAAPLLLLIFLDEFIAEATKATAAKLHQALIKAVVKKFLKDML